MPILKKNDKVYFGRPYLAAPFSTYECITFLFLYESSPIFFVNGPRMYSHFKTLKSIPIGTEIFFVDLFLVLLFDNFFLKKS